MTNKIASRNKSKILKSAPITADQSAARRQGVKSGLIPIYMQTMLQLQQEKRLQNSY